MSAIGLIPMLTQYKVLLNQLREHLGYGGMEGMSTGGELEIGISSITVPHP